MSKSDIAKVLFSDMFSFADVLLFATFILALLTYIDSVPRFIWYKLKKIAYPDATRVGGVR